MIYDYSILPEKKFVHIIANGNYSINDIKNLVELVTNDERYRPEFNSIVDIQDVKYTPVISEIIDFSDFIITMKKSFKAKVALVVKGEILYNLFKISSHHSNKNGIKVDIFNDLQKAKHWISKP